MTNTMTMNVVKNMLEVQHNKAENELKRLTEQYRKNLVSVSHFEDENAILRGKMEAFKNSLIFILDGERRDFYREEREKEQAI